MAAAVPRHGAHRAADDADAARASSSCSARRRTSSPRRRDWLRVDLGVPAARSPPGPTSRTRSRRARCGAPTRLDLSSVAARAQRCRAGRPERGRGVLRRRRAATASTPRRAFSVFGMAEATLAVTFPEPGRGHGTSTPSTATRSSTSAYAAPGPADARRQSAGSRCSGGRCRGFELRVVRPASRAGAAATARSASSSCAAPSVTPGLLPQPGGDRGRRSATAGSAPATSRYLVDGAARRVRSAQGRDHRRRPQRVPRGRRARGRGRSTACAPATSSPSAATGRRGREAIVVVAETKTDDLARRARRGGGARLRRGGRAAGRRRARAAGIAAQDVVGQAAAVPVPPALPRRRARAWSERTESGTAATCTMSEPSAGTVSARQLGPRDGRRTGSAHVRRRARRRSRPPLRRPTVAPVRGTTRPCRLFLVLLALTFVLRLPAFFVPVFNSDETFLATQAHVINDGRRALRGRHRPQAAARAVHLRGDVRVLRHHRAVVGARGRDARGRAHRAAARDRGAAALRRPRAAGSPASSSCSRSVAFAPQDGQAANFEMFMLPSMTAAILLARRGPRRRRGRRGRARDARQADRRGHAAARSLYLAAAARPREARRRRGRLGFAVPIALVALARRAGPAPLLDRARQRLVRRREDELSALVLRDVRRHDVGIRRRATCRSLWKLPSAWRDRASTRSTASATPTSGCGSSSAVVVGRGRPALLRPLLPAARSRRSCCSPPARSARASSAARCSGTVAFAAGVAVVFSAAGYFLHPFGPEPNYESVSRYLDDAPAPRRPDLRVGQRARDLLGVGQRPGDALPHARRSSPATTRAGPQDEATTDDDTRAGVGADFYEDFAAHPPTLLRRHVTGEGARRGVLPDLRASRASPRIVDEQYRYVVTIDGIDVYVRNGQSQVDASGSRSDEGPGMSGSRRRDRESRSREQLARPVADRVELVAATAAARAARRAARRRARRRRGTRRRRAAGGTGSPAKSQITVRSFHAAWNVSPWSMPTIDVVRPGRAGSGRPCGRCC